MRRRRKHKFRFFFLLFTGLLIAVLLLAIIHGSSKPSANSIGLIKPAVASATPLLSFAETDPTLHIIIPPHDDDSWELQNNLLVIRLHNTDSVSGILQTEGWLDQQIQYSLEDNIFILTLEVDNLPPIIRIAKRDNNYSIYWSEVGLMGKRIAIDPGHGGHDPGASGNHLAILEKDVTLAIALELEQMLLDAGAEVFMTRSTDTLVDTTVEPGRHIRPDLQKRRTIVEVWDPDFFLSIHINSWSDRYAGGIETYYNRHSFNGILNRRAAQLIQSALVESIGRRDRGIRYKEVSDAVLQTVNYPSALAEILYISNPTEEGIMAEPGFPSTAAEGLFLGIKDYFSGGAGR